MNYAYILTLVLLCALYATGSCCMKYIRNLRLFNILFGCLVYIPYLWLSWIVYNDVGFYDWNFQNT